MIGIFIFVLISPKPYHDTPTLRQGLAESHAPYEGTFYPDLDAIDYQGFVRE